MMTNTFNWHKQEKNSSNSSSEYIKTMELAIDGLCDGLLKESKEFSPKEFFREIHSYITKNDRLIYTNITNFIFCLEDEQRWSTFQTNLDNVINYVYSSQFPIDFPESEAKKPKQNLYLRTIRTILKIWDHANLARRQYLSFKVTDNEYSKIVQEKMKDAETKMTKEMNMQLISMVSIFTALSFLIFGGISSLDNIFLGVRDIPVTKLLIVGVLWCFCIMNLVFVFMFFISKMTGLGITSTQDVNANLVQKYPLVWWSNFILILILACSCWSYYIKREGFSSKVYELLNLHPVGFFTIGTIAIIIVFSFIAGIIYKLFKADTKIHK